MERTAKSKQCLCYCFTATKATPVLGPGDWDLFDPALWAVDPWDVGLDEGLPLHRIEMAPASRTGIVTGYHGLTLRAV